MLSVKQKLVLTEENKKPEYSLDGFVTNTDISSPPVIPLVRRYAVVKQGSSRCLE
jgi:hypothetical protein